MKYKVGDKVRVRRDLRHGERIPFGVAVDMAEMAGAIVTISEAIEGSPDKYRLEEDRDGYSWCEQMFEPVEQFTSGGIVHAASHLPSVKISGMEPESEYHKMRFMSGTIRLKLSTERKDRNGIESRKDIRKRLLKL